MNSLLKSAFFISFMAVVIIGCKKKEEDEATPKTKSQLLVGDWVMINQTWAPPLDTYDVWKTIPTCEKDNIHHFSIDGAGYDDQGKTSCEPIDPNTNPQQEAFNWEWIDNETNLKLLYTGDTAFSIFYDVKFSGSTVTVMNEPASERRTTYVFQKQ